MEEIYLLMFLLILFAVAIYFIIQIPEVKDYITPASGDLSNRVTLSNTSNDLSNRVTLSNTSNDLSNRVKLSNTSNDLFNYNSNSNLVSNFSNILIGTPKSGILSNDKPLVYTNLNYTLLNDGSIVGFSNNYSMYTNFSKLDYLNSAQRTSLDNLIILDLNNSNYNTIEQVSEHAKGYVLSNIIPPNITLSDMINIFFGQIASIMSDSNFDFFFNYIVNNTDISYDDMNMINRESAAWYLNNKNNPQTSNYINYIASYIMNNLSYLAPDSNINPYSYMNP